jgi:PAS domain S-box-containing protein
VSKRSHKSARVIVSEDMHEVPHQDAGQKSGSIDEQEMESKGSKSNTVVTIDRRRYPHLEAIVANTSDAMIAIDEHFQVLELNPAAEAALGVSGEKAIGCNCSEVLGCRNLNKMEICGTSSCPLVRVLQLKQPLSNEELIIGDNCEVSASVTPIDAGNGEMQVIMTARDMSSLKVANRVRANFVSMVSHELRTPLNSVHGFVDLLLQGHMGELTEEQKKYLGYAGEGVQQLISIVEDILFMTRSDVGQFEIKQQPGVNLLVLAGQVVTSLEPQARKAGVVINKEIPSPSPLLYVDPQRMKQVLNNLVTNAIKFTPPEGTVTIRAREHNEQFALISVADTGFGIPMEDRQHVFERFYQSNHVQQSKMGGYGLGLSIARLIVEQHGGTIYFESTSGKGTTFFFTAPLDKRQVSG